MLPEKYYIEFAKIFNKNKVIKPFNDFSLGEENMRQYIINDFITLMEKDNNNFDINKFNKACDK